LSAADSAVQTGVYSRLVAVSAVTDLLADGASGVYDFVPQRDTDLEAEFPYIVLGEMNAETFDADDRLGHDVTVIVHTWDRAKRGKKPTQQIMSAIYDALHRYTSLSVSGFTTVECRWDGLSEVMLDPDGLTYHGVQRFRVIATTGA